MASEQTTRKNGDPYNEGIAWLLLCAASALGATGTTASVVAMIERGGAVSGGDHEHIRDDQIGWGKQRTNTTARYRRLQRIWSKLPLEHRLVLTAYYVPDNRLPKVAEQQLGRWARVVWEIHDTVSLARIDRACVRLQKAQGRGFGGRSEPEVPKALSRAREAVRVAHEWWNTARELEDDAWVA